MRVVSREQLEAIASTNPTPAANAKVPAATSPLAAAVEHSLRSRYELGLQVRELYEDDLKNNLSLLRRAVSRNSRHHPGREGRRCCRVYGSPPTIGGAKGGISFSAGQGQDER